MTLLKMAQELTDLQIENENLKRTLQSLVSEVQSVQVSGQYWFGPFKDSTDSGQIYWPQLGVITDQAEKQIGGEKEEHQFHCPQCNAQYDSKGPWWSEACESCGFQYPPDKGGAK